MCRAEALGGCLSTTGPQHQAEQACESQHPEDGQCPWPGSAVQAPRGICVLCDTTTHAAQQLHQGGCWFWRIPRETENHPHKGRMFHGGQGAARARLGWGFLRSLPCDIGGELTGNKTIRAPNSTQSVHPALVACSITVTVH